jgi:hypothetical protein
MLLQQADGHMLEFGNRNRPVPAFSLDRKDQVRRSHMRKREWRAVIMLPVAILVLGIFINFLIHMGEDLGAITKRQPQIGHTALSPMAHPQLEQATALPAPSTASADATEVEYLLAHPEAVAAKVQGPDALGLAWADAQLAEDAKAPPVPQRFEARDLELAAHQAGVACMLGGRLEDIVDASIAGTARLRLLLALGDSQYAEVIAPANPNLIAGNTMQAVGRLLGTETLPTPQGPVQVPVLAARTTQAVAAAVRPEDAEPGHDWALPGRFVLPDGIWEDLDDEHTYVETRPYYFALGQARQDAAAPADDEHPLDLNAIADAVHQEPSKYRDQVVKLKGQVYDAWQDAGVDSDHPFGIQRVIRVLLLHTDYGPITENIHGKDVRHNKLVLRLFEVALATDQPLPEHLSPIEVTGRFLKFHAIPVKPDEYRDRAHGVERQSDNDYAYFVVGTHYTPLPLPALYDLKSLEIGLISAVIVLVITFWRLSRRETRAAETVQAQVLMLRATRRRLQSRSPAPATPPPATPPPPTDASPTAAPKPPTDGPGAPPPAAGPPGA